jgi:hypothetical protein
MNTFETMTKRSELETTARAQRLQKALEKKQASTSSAAQP